MNIDDEYLLRAKSIKDEAQKTKCTDLKRDLLRIAHLWENLAQSTLRVEATDTRSLTAGR